MRKMSLCLGVVLFCGLALSEDKMPEAKPFEIVGRIPHSGYSEGIEFYEGFLWHALPKKILKIDPNDGSILAEYEPATTYSESLTWFMGKIWNLSWHDNGLYSGEIKKDKIVWTRRASTPEAHGWGIAHNGKELILTGHESNQIYFLNPKTLKVKRKIAVPIPNVNLEDLAWDGKHLWSSSFLSLPGTIFAIDPVNGKVLGYFRFPKPEECPVIDGLAYDGKVLWVTGKNCISIYQVKKPL